MKKHGIILYHKKRKKKMKTREKTEKGDEKKGKT